MRNREAKGIEPCAEPKDILQGASAGSIVPSAVGHSKNAAALLTLKHAAKQIFKSKNREGSQPWQDSPRCMFRISVNDALVQHARLLDVPDLSLA